MRQKNTVISQMGPRNKNDNNDVGQQQFTQSEQPKATNPEDIN
jgi:hypothetical protein